MNDGSPLMDSPLNGSALPEKALWYQEVLSLDPNSRIFLPYARLLAELGRGVEAVEVLKSGLLRHPEFLDARLLLIELLHAAGQDAAAGFEASGIIEQLSQCSALWQIWSRRPGLRADQAAMLLFFGSSLNSNSHSLAEVFEAGIAALAGKPSQPVPSAPAEARQNTIAPAASTGTEKMPAPAEALPSALPAASTAPMAVTPAASDCALDGSAPTVASPAPAAQAVSSAPLFTLDENAPWYSLDAVPDDDEIYGDEPEVPAVLPAFLMAAAAASSASGESAAPQPLETAQSAPAEAQPAEAPPPPAYSPAPCTVPRGTQEGKSSLCTRSMARILEEQGATSEAADIYRELLASCSSDEERDELNAKLDSLLQGADPAASASPSAQPSPGVLDMLEELAVRLETRSRA